MKQGKKGIKSYSISQVSYRRENKILGGAYFNIKKDIIDLRIK